MDNDFNIYEQTPITPQMDELTVKPSGDPLQMRGLSHVIGVSYQEGMNVDYLQQKVGSAVNEQISAVLETYDPNQIETIMSFLKNVDYNLTMLNNKVVEEDKGFTR